MKLKDKHFWIFQILNIFYAIGLIILEYMELGKSSIGEMILLVASLCGVTSVIAWHTAFGKHWVKFGLYYNFIFVSLLLIYLLINILLAGLLDGELDIYNILYCIPLLLTFIIPVAVVTFLPSLALSFLGYHLFVKNEKS